MKKLLLGLGIIFLGSQPLIAMNDNLGEEIENPSCLVQAGVNTGAVLGCIITEPLKLIVCCLQYSMGDPENDWSCDEMASFENMLSFRDIKKRFYAQGILQGQ